MIVKKKKSIIKISDFYKINIKNYSFSFKKIKFYIVKI
jgi:hypothetical protein